MTLSELRDAFEGLPQLPGDTPVVVEDEQGNVREVLAVESEPDHGIVVIELGGVLDI